MKTSRNDLTKSHYSKVRTVYNRFTLPTARYKILFGTGLILTGLGGLIGAHAIVGHTTLSRLTVKIDPAALIADGEAIAIVSIKGGDATRPGVSFEGNSHGAVIDSIELKDDIWRARIRVGVLPGQTKLRIESPGYEPTAVQFTTDLDDRDSAADGTPDFLRLDDESDQQAFRNWFIWLAEAQYFQPQQTRPAEINDCAALIRFAYRGALHLHDSAWANSAGLPELPPFESLGRYHYPLTPLGASLFRVHQGPFRQSDLTTGAFLQFADAQTLWRFNTHLVSRNISRAQPGDLLFFRRQSSPPTFHGMIYLGESKIHPDGHRYLLYHTGPDGSRRAFDPGEIRRPTVDELMRFPQPEWRPIASNPAFLGVMRWNILRRPVDESDALLQ